MAVRAMVPSMVGAMVIITIDLMNRATRPIMMHAVMVLVLTFSPLNTARQG